jgi:hypothetical protein
MEFSASPAPPNLISPPAEVLPEERIRQSFRLPSWLVSLLLHVALILVLAVVPFIEKMAVPFIISGTLGTEDVTVPFEISDMSNSAKFEGDINLAPSVDVESLVKIDLATQDPVEPVLFGALASKSAPELSLSGRSGSLKASLLAAYGGTPGTEKAVEEGLAWLVKQQRSDGTWSLRGPYTNGGTAENKSAATAMALLALAGAGHTHRDGTYRANVQRGLNSMLALQDADGFFATDAPDRQQMYAQGQCTIALCELYGMTGDQSLRVPAQRALEFAEKSQGGGGGRRYQPREDSDTSVTGWFVMALMSGRMAGLSTDNRTLKGVDRFLDSVQSDDGSRYSYTELSRPSFSMTAEGLLCREYLGWKRDDPRLIKGCELLAEQTITGSIHERSYYYWYYATQTLHHFGGSPWEKWNVVMREELPKLQAKDGKDRGSWPPQGDEHASSGGRLFATCFSIYCLEVYYRHLPLYGLSR